MKTPLIKIFASSSKDMTHYIFRSEDKNIDKNIEEFINNQTPVGAISESVDKDFLKKININNATMSINENPKMYNGFSALSLPFEFCLPGRVFEIHIKNSSDLVESIIITFYIGINNIFKIIKKYNGNEDVITDQDIINSEFKLSDNKNCILIKNSIFNNCIASFYGEIEVYYYYDDGLKFDDECSPDKGHGIYKPILNMIEAKDYLSFYQESTNRKNTYYYNVVSKLSDNTVSEISNTQVCEISELVENIEYKLQSTDLYFTKENLEESDWTTIAKTNPSSEIRVDKSKLVSNIIPIDNFSIYANDTDLRLQNSRELKITNIWNVDNKKLTEREKKTFRAVNSYKDVIRVSDPVIFNDKEVVLIDKILVLKKDVTNITNKTAPIKLNDKDGETLKIFVRQGGIYYKDFFLNDNNTNDYDEPTPSYILSSITSDSRFPMLNIKDDCIYGNQYNYTVYLYDELGKTSDPISVVL